MTNNRPKVPADIKRRVLLEAGHRCAVCRHIDVDIHHIVPWEQCTEHRYENLIALCPNCHRRADQGEIDRKSLRAYKANLRLAHDRFTNFEVDMLFHLYKNPGNWFELPHYLLLLVNRIIEMGYAEKHRIRTPGSFPLDGKPGVHSVSEIIEDYAITLTDKGREYLGSLGIAKEDDED